MKIILALISTVFFFYRFNELSISFDMLNIIDQVIDISLLLEPCNPIRQVTWMGTTK